MLENVIKWLLILGFSMGMGGLAYRILKPYVLGEAIRRRRLNEIAKGQRTQQSMRGLQKDKRRRQLQEMLNELNAENKTQARKRESLAVRLRRAGLNISASQFYMFAAASGVVTALLVLVFTGSLLVSGAAMFVGGIGIPLWLLNYLRRKREEKFLQHLPDAIDVLVRSLRAGLPMNDAMKMIAQEIPEPVGPEFAEIVEGQRVGIPLDQGFQRMYERMPLPEVNFLSIVVSLQSKTGGNLSEALDNLSKVLRDRQNMKLKVKTLSQEAKVSAAIIGAIPILIFAILSLLNPQFIAPLIETKVGNLIMLAGIVWMSLGVLIMRKMINFKF